jgi:2-methylcitrate dehydratase
VPCGAREAPRAARRELAGLVRSVHRGGAGRDRITIYTKDQRILLKQQLGCEGGLAKPMFWDRAVEKFHWLSEPFADEVLRSRLIEAVQRLDARPISDLMDLLSQVRPAAAFPATHSGIQ